jgi:hypothetical protein
MKKGSQRTDFKRKGSKKEEGKKQIVKAFVQKRSEMCKYAQEKISR